MNQRWCHNSSSLLRYKPVISHFSLMKRPFFSWPCLNSSPEPNFPSILLLERPHTWRAFITLSQWLPRKPRRPKRIICKASKDTRSTTLELPFPKDTSGIHAADKLPKKAHSAAEFLFQRVAGHAGRGRVIRRAVRQPDYGSGRSAADPGRPGASAVCRGRRRPCAISGGRFGSCSSAVPDERAAHYTCTIGKHSHKLLMNESN